MKFRYFISLIFTIIFLILIYFVTGSSYYSTLIFDLPSALVVIVFPLIFMWILYGWKNIRSSFLIFSEKNKSKNDLSNAKAFFENYCKVIFSMAFIAFIISFMSIMIYIDEAVLGPNMAVASIVLLYAGILNMVIIIPYKIIINRKIIEIEE